MLVLRDLFKKIKKFLRDCLFFSLLLILTITSSSLEKNRRIQTDRKIQTNPKKTRKIIYFYNNTNK
jgi:hypothetical protein